MSSFVLSFPIYKIGMVCVSWGPWMGLRLGQVVWWADDTQLLFTWAEKHEEASWENAILTEPGVLSGEGEREESVKQEGHSGTGPIGHMERVLVPIASLGILPGSAPWLCPSHAPGYPKALPSRKKPVWWTISSFQALESKDLGSNPSPAVWPWASDLTSLGSLLHLCKIGMIRIPLRSLWGKKRHYVHMINIIILICAGLNEIGVKE